MKFPIASPGKRFISWLVDILIFILLFLVSVFSITAAANFTHILTAAVNHIIWFWIWLPLLYPFLSAFLISRFGGSPGQLLTGLAVVNPQGNFISYKRALFRLYVGPPVAGLLFGLGYFWIFIDREHRGWHDQISDTYVVVTHPPLVYIGIFISLLFIATSVWIIIQTYDQFTAHLPVYRRIGQDINEEINTALPSPTPTPPLFYKYPIY